MTQLWRRLLRFLLQGHRKYVFTVRDGNWSDPAVWERGILPGKGDRVVVTHDLVIDAPATIGTDEVAP